MSVYIYILYVNVSAASVPVVQALDLTAPQRGSAKTLCVCVCVWCSCYSGHDMALVGTT